MYFFIVNPHSRCGKGEQIWKKLKKLLDQKAVDYKSYLTEKPGDAREYSRRLTKNCQESRIIVAVGGDGTLNEVVDGLCFGGMITLGYIPIGSGNDFARSLKLSINPKKMLNKILSSQYYQCLDYGVLTYGNEAEHRRFAVSAGLGMDGAVCQKMPDFPFRKILCKLRMERFGYVLLGIRKLIEAKPSKGYILLDRVKKIEFNHIYFISAHIHPYEGGGFQFAPKADSSDGKLSVCVVSHESKRKLFSVMASAFFRLRKVRRGIRTYECREAFFHVERPMAVHADGEFCGMWEDFQAECIEKKIRLIL